MEVDMLKFVWNAVLTLLVALGGAIWKQMDRKFEILEGKVEENSKQLSKVREEYVHKEELKDWKNEILKRFDKLEDHLLKRD